MTHDAECLRAWPTDRYLPCICGRLARVRADERERAAERIENAPWAEESWIAYEQRIIDLAAARGAAGGES